MDVQIFNMWLGENSKYYLNSIINPVGTGSKEVQQPGGFTKRGKDQEAGLHGWQKHRAQVQWASSQPRDSDLHLQDRKSEGNRILELGKTRSCH